MDNKKELRSINSSLSSICLMLSTLILMFFADRADKDDPEDRAAVNVVAALVGLAAVVKAISLAIDIAEDRKS